MTLLIRRTWVPALLFFFCLMTPAKAGHHASDPGKKAIVLAAFGTSYPQALESILNIQDKVAKAYPDTHIRLAFTSSIIRGIWQKRRDDKQWILDNPSIPEQILQVKSPLATLGLLHDEGYKDITVQPLHIFAGEEFADLKAVMVALHSIRTIKKKSLPFATLRLGRPALGMPGDVYPYMDDIRSAAHALAADAKEAKDKDAVLVYMGHGNDFYSTGIYAEFQREMQAIYNHPVYVACVEGYPAFDDLLNALKTTGKKDIIMKPFMVVAGDHASNDMAGDEEDSWKVMLTEAGYNVETELRGLGSVDAFAQMYADHLKDALAQTHMLP